MKKYQIWTAVFWAALGVFVSLLSYRLGLGKVRSPGSGLFPFCLGLLFFLLAMMVLIQAVRRPPKEQEGPKEERPPANLRKLGLVTAALFAYALLVEWLGYQITTFLTLALLFWSAGYRKWVQALGYSFVVVIITYFLFTYLGVRFPPGIFRLLGLD